MVALFHLPSGFVLARYARLSPGQFAVVTPSGQVLASSFFELRHQFAFHSTIAGSGQWVVLVLRSSLFCANARAKTPSASQSSLF